ncbi:hypothetical protein JB92DRAFT_3099138 [Gautieria morchelliformis]|nr:hypothetical protein JB92DRAFT_3099138 [Gautieria morchelliformis]
MQSRISGWLQLVAKETKEEQKEQEKEAQNVSESVRLAIVTGERPRHKRRRSQSPSCDDSGEENEGSTVMVEFLEEARAEERKARDEEKKARAEEREEERKAHNALLEERHRVNDQQERTNAALLDILRQALLN